MTVSTLSIIVNGVETQLSSLGALVSHVGWGSPDYDTYSLRAPGQHGDTWGGFALAPRIGALIFKMNKTELDDMYTLRAQLLSLFTPLADPILKFVTPQGTRHFDCHVYNGPKLDWVVDDWAAQSFVIQLKCGDAACYDPTGLAWTFSLDAGSDTMEVPTVIPMTVGASIINKILSITYAGTWGSFPFIRVIGPITDCVINNTGTHEVLDFTGTTIEAGDYYDIDTRFGLKTVTDNAGAYQNSKLVASQLNTFHIGAAPEVAGGINPIRVTGSDVTTATAVQVSYFVRDLGV